MLDHSHQLPEGDEDSAKCIEAQYVPGSDSGSFTGQGDFLCPVCGKKVAESDLETYEDETNPADTVEICSDCREDFESDCELVLESADILPSATFLKLYEWAKESIRKRAVTERIFDETQAEAVAAALGGYTWQSGGGILLVLIHKKNGHVVVISDEVVSEYSDETMDGKPIASILLR